MADQQTIPASAEVDGRVDLWHAGGCPAAWSMADALGMTDAEYAVWMRDPAAVPARALPELPRHRFDARV